MGRTVDVCAVRPQGLSRCLPVRRAGVVALALSATAMACVGPRVSGAHGEGSGGASGSGGSNSPNAPAAGLTRRVRRLSNHEYDNVVRDLLGDTTQPSRAFLISDSFA